MAERSDTNNSFGWPILALAAIATMFLPRREEDFRTPRPSVSHGYEESRLWHDPLDEEKLKFAKTRERAPRGNSAILISVPSTSSFEDSEWRVRTRFALHAAMTTCEFVPADATRLQCRSWKISPTSVADAPMPTAFQRSFVEASSSSEDGKAPERKDEKPTWLSIETFDSVAEKKRESIDVYWLPEHELSAQLGRGWAQAAIAMARDGNENRDIVFVGPSSTYFAEQTDFEGVNLRSPWVTGKDMSRLPPRFPSIPFICQDRQLAETLASELRLRGVSSAQEVLLVLERDSTFAREWQHHMERTFQSGQPFQIAWFSRGLDGTPTEASKTEASKQVSGGSSPSAIEEPVGGGTLDYLRRLRHELRTQPNLSATKAVGIFGQDIRDKVLIVKALRPVFSDASFFTGDLDALYSHPTYLPYTRNMVVASGHGLRPAATGQGVHPSQGVITPFRDSYQTAAYLALHNAIDKDHEPYPPFGLVFEIGNNGPVQLDSPLTTMDVATAARPATASRLVPWSWSLLAILGVLLTGALVFTGLQGKRPAEEAGHGGWNILALFVVTLCAFVLIGIWWSDEPAGWLDGISVWPTEILGLLSLVLSLVFAYHVCRLFREQWPGESSRAQLTADAADATMASAAVAMILKSLKRLGRALGRALAALGRALALVWRVACRRPHVVNGSPTAAAPAATSFSEDRHARSAVILASALFVVGSCIMAALGIPRSPVRGQFAGWVDTIVMLTSVLAMLWLVFLVTEAARHYAALCHREERERQMLTSALTGQADLDALTEAWSLRRSFLRDLAHAGGHGIYGPFIVILVLCLSRWHGFDNWSWSIGLRIVVGICCLCVLFAHIYLHREATGLRDRSVKALDDTIDRTPNKEHATQLDHLRKGIAELRQGIFGGPANHPVVRGLVIPFSGIGGLSLLQWLQAV